MKILLTPSKTILLIFISIAGIVFSTCNEKHQNKEQDDSQILKEVESTLNQYYKDVSINGLTAEFPYLDSSKDFFWVPPGFATALAIDSVITIINKNSRLYKKVNNKITELKLHLLSESTASYWAIINSEMTNNSDSTSRFKLIETGTMIKRDNKWKLLNGHTSLLNN